MDHLHERLERLEQRTHTVECRLRWWRGTALLLLILGLVSLPWQGTKTQAQEEVTAQALTLAQRVAALEAKLKYLNTRIDSSGRPLMEIAGANLRLINSAGNTRTANGLGNLIVGYNEIRQSPDNARTGSHNVIIGREQNYSSYGGLVVGETNDIKAPFSLVSGAQNIATSDFTSISGGFANRANGTFSAIVGGANQVTNGWFSSVTGGAQNVADGQFSSVTGGNLNTAVGVLSSISGGTLNITQESAELSSISGGASHSVSGPHDWAAGALFEDE